MVLNGIHRQYLHTAREVFPPPFHWEGAGSQIKLVLILEKERRQRANPWQRMARRVLRAQRAADRAGLEDRPLQTGRRRRAASQVFIDMATRHTKFYFVWGRSKKSEQAIFTDTVYRGCFHSCNLFSLKKKKKLNTWSPNNAQDIFQYSPILLVSFTPVLIPHIYNVQGQGYKEEADCQTR